jgi:hypothetical protein
VAVLGGLLLAGLLSWAFYSHSVNVGREGTGTPAQYALLLVCYVPLLAWPPLLIAVAVSYYRRRTSHFPLPVTLAGRRRPSGRSARPWCRQAYPP